MKPDAVGPCLLSRWDPLRDQLGHNEQGHHQSITSKVKQITDVDVSLEFCLKDGKELSANWFIKTERKILSTRSYDEE